MISAIFEHASLAAEFIRSRISIQPRMGVVLGSGLGAFVERIDDAVAIPYAEIPHFPLPTVAGHNGFLRVGTLDGVPITVMQGRLHRYEGRSSAEVAFPIRVLRRLGITTLIVTNASGGIREDLHQGDLVLMSDHINLTGTNPLIGPNEERFGERFFDMTEAYSSRLRTLTHDVSGQLGFAIPEGVYLAVTGPSFETPAEIRAFRALGADMVGMSTVHEVIVARHMEMEVLGISCVTNMAAGLQGAPLTHKEVLETGRQVEQRLGLLLASVIGGIHRKNAR